MECAGEDAGAKLWEEEVVTRADGTVALVLGRPMVAISSDPLRPAWVASPEAKASLVKTFKLSSLWCKS